MTVMQRAELERLRVGDVAACDHEVTERDIEAFAGFSRDDNALHMDEQFALDRGFAGRVAHGMIALSLISRLIGTQLPGHGSLWMSQQLDFVQPVHAGDHLRASVTVDRISHAARVAVLSTLVVKPESDAVVLRGTAKVRIP
jgi:3-hydroxybutyryl-CoA dehydratase